MSDQERVEEVMKQLSERRNACGYCGAFRIDGLPPRVHERGCPNYADGLTESIMALTRPGPASGEVQ